ncbi:DUF6708 domain-containing protein [Pseudomonas urmiensis]
MKKMTQPLPRRAPGWKYDLNKPNEKPQPSSPTARLRTPPNHFCDTYLELPRSTIRLRGVGIFGGIVCICAISATALMIIYTALTPSFELEVKYTLLSLFFIALMYWTVIPTIRMDIEFPRDEPIRFNRLRRKVYFYQYHFDRFHLFSRQRWGVRPVVYDWDDLVAEACSVYAPMGNGGLIENVVISVIKPGTEEVIDRLFFTHDIEQGKQYWALAQLFMQQGPQALPEFVHPPRDWNDDSQLSPIHCIAPKVRWPEEIDFESRSAPCSY